MAYNSRKKLQEELELDLLEIEAYRSLDNEVFDFGEGEMRNDGEFNLGSEDAYYEIELEQIQNALWNLKHGYVPEQNSKMNSRPNNYYRKMISKKKVKRLSQFTWWVAYYDEKAGYHKRCYLSGRKGYAKYCSRRKVRHSFDFPLKGNGYRKCYDYWWTVF